MSSDYGDDDEDFLLNLGDDDLRMLEEVEEKCGVELSQVNSVVNHRTNVAATSTRGINPPPPKRAKVGAQVPAQDVHGSDDDTPDILVNADGTYSLDSPEPSLVSIRGHSLAFSGSSKSRAPEPAQQRSVSSTHAPMRNGGTFSARPLQRHDSSNSLHGLDTPPSTQGARPLVRAGSLSQAISRGLAKNGALLSQNSVRIEKDTVARPHDAHLQKELDDMRAQLMQAESERQRLRTSLEESKENSFAKAGEAENLRRTMRKQTEQHAEEITRLRQEMAEAENAKSEVERRMKLEMDQLRTAMTFKDDGRRTTLASFPKKEGVERSHAPSATSRKEKSFNNLTNSFSKSTSPVKQPRIRSKKPDESTFDFEGVMTSTQHPAKDKGKGKAKAEDNWLDENTSTPIQRLTFGTQNFWDQPRYATQAPFAIEPDIFGSNAPPQTPVKVAETAQYADVIEPVNYVDELRMVLLTHIVLFRPPEGQKTFSLQHLLAVSVGLDLQKRFNAACTSLFDAFSAPSSLGDGVVSSWGLFATKASLSLVQLAQIFEDAESLDALHILFNLLTAICTAVPNIAEYLLKAGAQEGDSLLASTILSALARTPGVLPIMLDLSYPPAWTTKATRALSVLASRPALVRGLLIFPESDPPTPHDPAKIPLVELLCRHISAYRKHDDKDHYRELYENVLTTLSQLAIADTQTLTTLVDSLTLIPSLVSFIYHVTSVIWTELELSENTTRSDSNCLFNALRLAIQLLHYLSFSSDPEPNVRERLCYAPRGTFNGLIHMFIVAFGRLSSADPPEYLDETRSATLREIRGMSEALLGIVVDGPEVEGIYDVFHDSEEDERGGFSQEKVPASVEDEEEALQMSIDGF
ncbi:hypothetical protein FRC09_003373 [Ceratobasidium sp. 395]|nr:hypothetical protein FRC09_003373 [Ceratobasidium sp. 395]